MNQQLDSIESEDWTAMEWPHIPEEMITRLRPIWEGYPNHQTRAARLDKVEKRTLLSMVLTERMKEANEANELKEHFSIHGTVWKKRRDEAMRAFLGDYHLQ